MDTPNDWDKMALVERMIENIAEHGTELTFQKIDEHIRNPLQRCMYRKYFLQAVKTLGLEWELHETLEDF